MDKYEETAKKIVCGVHYADIGWGEMADILREAFPMQEPNDKPQAEASEELINIAAQAIRELSQTIRQDQPHLSMWMQDGLEALGRLQTICARPAPTAEKALREALAMVKGLLKKPLENPKEPMEGAIRSALYYTERALALATPESKINPIKANQS